MGQSTRTYVGLDIGTTKISCIIADLNGTGEMRVVGVGNAPSEGLRRGVVVDLDKTVGSVQRAVDEAERMAGFPVKGVHAGIAGDHIRSINSRGVIAVSRRPYALEVARAQGAELALCGDRDAIVRAVFDATGGVGADRVFEVVGLQGPLDLAGELNTEMPLFWVRKVSEALNLQGRAVRGASVLVLGVAYKRDIDDIRESPALDIIRHSTAVAVDPNSLDDGQPHIVCRAWRALAALQLWAEAQVDAQAKK